MSDAQIAERAQASFEFNEAVSARAFKRALVREFRRVCDETGIDHDEAYEGPLRRAVELFALTHPDALPDALKEAQARALVTEPADAVPPLFLSEGDDARPSRLGAYDVFPPKTNGNERRFAELLDADESGQVLW